MNYNHNEFLQFTITAKINTYASKGDAASVEPVLRGSKQLEYKLNDYYYRDIYYGMEYFVGIETIEYKSIPIWSMVYSGGIVKQNLSTQEIKETYSFLRDALLMVTTDLPYRGPKSYEKGKLLYKNDVKGGINNFSGHEMIFHNSEMIYELRYSGGFTK